MIKEQRSREDAAKTASENKDKNKKISDPIEKKGKRGKKVSSENKDKSENTEGKKSEDVNNLTAVPPVVDEEDKK
ncbi:hypothetical protein HGB07_05765 [Candidatus Roizmanbacteria bacterium]|nr:hypothetical protein [Candidatus Roizmanbacteria bacterium]